MYVRTYVCMYVCTHIQLPPIQDEALWAGPVSKCGFIWRLHGACWQSIDAPVFARPTASACAAMILFRAVLLAALNPEAKLGDRLGAGMNSNKKVVLGVRHLNCSFRRAADDDDMDRAVWLRLTRMRVALHHRLGPPA
jgi:hypothetical protein